MSNTTGVTNYVSCRIQEYLSLSTKRFEDARYKNNVHFLKQSKVGGSTISSVLRKIILKYGALLVPFEIINVKDSTKNREIPQTEFEKRIGPRRMLLYKGGKCRLFYSQHCGIWDYSRRASPMAEKLFTNNDTAFLTIVRHPVEKFKSQMQWSGYNPQQIHSKIISFKNRCPYLESSGCVPFVDILPCNSKDDDTCVKGMHSLFNKTRALNYLAKFDLVMVTEKMPESIVIMANVLGFPVEELGTVKLKAVSTKFHNYTQFEEEILDKFYQGNKKFHNLAAEKLEELKRDLGIDMAAQEMAKLKKANIYTESVCGYQYVPETESTDKHQSKFTIKITEMLSDPLKLAECLPLLDAPRNKLESYTIEALEAAYKHTLNSSVNRPDNSLEYPYSLLKFYETFKKISITHLKKQTVFH